MPKIVRILIKGTSGYCSISDAYKDKVTITPSSIAYEYKPYAESDANGPVRWSYRTSSPKFGELFARVADEAAGILTLVEEVACDDIGSVTFVVTYDDNSRAQREFYLPGNTFAECFALVKEMVPQLEAAPSVLMTSEDY